MPDYNRRQVLKTTGVGVGLLGAGQVGGQESKANNCVSGPLGNFEVCWDSIPEPVVGEPAEFGIEVTIAGNAPGCVVPPYPDFDVEIELYVGGGKSSDVIVTIGCDETESAVLEHTFEQAGEVEVEVEANILDVGGSLLDISTSVFVTPEDWFEIEFDALPEPTVCEETEFDINVDIFDFEWPSATNSSGVLNLELLIDGESIQEKSPNVSPGDDFIETFTHAFESWGEKQVSIEGELDLPGDTDFDTDVATIDVLPDPVEVSGAAFEIPSFLGGEIEDFRNDLPDIGMEEFEPLIVANEDQLILAFIPKEPKDGLVTIEGYGFCADFEPVGFDLTAGAIVATESVEFVDEATQVTLQELSNNPSEYTLERVEVIGENSHLTASVRTRFNIDEEENTQVNFPTQTGVLVEEPPEISNMFPSPGGDLFHIVNEPSKTSMERVLPDKPDGVDPFVFTGQFEDSFWESAEKNPTGVVIPPETPAAEFVEAKFFKEPDHEMRDKIHGIVHANGNPLLYLHEESYNTRDDINSVSDIKAAEDIDGDLVELNDVYVGQFTVSVQETIESVAACPPPDTVNIQGYCLPIFHDILLHGGAAMDPELLDSELPEDVTDYFVGLIGISSWDQEMVSKLRAKKHDIVAEVVDTSRFNENLPDGFVLIVYDMDEGEQIDFWDEVEDTVGDTVDNIVETLEGSIEIDEELGYVPLPPEPLPSLENPPQDLNNNGRYEDVDGSGEFDIFDVQALFSDLDSDAVQDYPMAFNFTEDENPEEVTIFDVQALFNRLKDGE
jgi:hypothetical protein